MTDEHDTVENVASGVSITAKLKRGTGTRDQDEIKIKAKGKTAEEAADNMDQTIAEAREWAGELRQIQPEQEDLRIVFAGEGPHKEFVEVENEQGESVDVGEWVEDGEYSVLELGGRE